MSIEQKIIAARPHKSATNEQFVAAVRRKINRKPCKRAYNSFVGALRRSPVMVVLILIAALGILTGSVYAVSYLWPRLNPSVSAPQKSASGRQSVNVTQCDTIDSTKRYELKSGAPISPDNIDAVVKAQCELDAVTKWAQEAYPVEQRPERTNINAPGAEFEDNHVLPAMLVVKVINVNKDSLTLADAGSLMERDIQLSPDVKYVVDGKYVELSPLKPGDAVSYVSRSITKVKNRSDCTDAYCQGDVVSSSETVLEVIKMKYSFDTYRSIKYLTELSVCMGNPSDECPSLSSIDLYERLGDVEDNFEVAEVSGKIADYNDQSITITTTSGRKVTVGTPWNVIGTFNSGRSADYGHTVGIGDTLSINYYHSKDTTNDSDIPWKQVLWVRLLMEAASKVGPYQNY